MIADANIKDSYTVYCGIILTPASRKEKGVDKWKVSRATDGTIRDCSIFNASPGYGLVQIHGARNILFENLYALGGVTLRIETGAGGLYAGAFDLYGKNIACENGVTAVMMGPHTTKNGTVKVDGVTAKSCVYAATAGSGFIDRKHKNDPDAELGSFADDSEIKNVHAIFGMNAQIAKKGIYQLEPEYYDDIRKADNDYAYHLVGPSVGAVKDGTKGNWKITFKNVTSEGFKYNKDKVLTAADFAEREKDKWNIVKKIPVCAEVTKKPQNEDVKAPKAGNKKDSTKKSKN